MVRDPSGSKTNEIDTKRMQQKLISQCNRDWHGHCSLVRIQFSVFNSIGRPVERYKTGYEK